MMEKSYLKNGLEGKNKTQGQNKSFLVRNTINGTSNRVFNIVMTGEKENIESTGELSNHQKKRNELLNRASIASTLPEIIEKQLEDIHLSDVSTKNFSDFCDEFIQKISDTYPEFIPKEIKIIQEQIRKYLNQKRSVQIYLEKYRENPNEFVKLAFGVNPVKQIEMKVIGANLVLYSDFADFNMIKSRGTNMAPLSSGEGVSFKGIALPGIENAVLMISGKIDTIEKHELMHGRNVFLMPEKIQEKTKLEPLTRGKDEIIAFIRSELLFEEIRNILFGEGYDYFSELKDTPEYPLLRKEYIDKMEKYIHIAEELVKKGTSCDELSITPIEKWQRLNKNKHLEILRETIGKNYPDGSYEGKQEFKNGIIFEGVFGADKKLIVGIKKFSYFYEEGTFLPIFDNEPRVHIAKYPSKLGDIDIKHSLKNYERDYMIYEILSRLRK